MKRGFAQIPILLAILIGTALIGSSSYFIVNKISKPSVITETQTSEKTATTTEGKPEEETSELPTPVVQNPPTPQQSALLPIQVPKTEPASVQIDTADASTTVAASTTTLTTTQAAKIPKVKVAANPSSVEYYGTSTISWVATDALSCSLDSSPFLFAVTGSQLVNPTDLSKDWTKTNSVTYTVTCTGAGGSVSGDATVIVQPWVPPSGYKVSPDCGTVSLRKSCITGPGAGTICDFDGKCSSSA